MLRKLSSYFNRCKFLITLDSSEAIKSLPKCFDSVLFKYSICGQHSGGLQYSGEYIADPVVKYVESLQCKPYIERSYQGINITKINESKALVSSRGLVPAHHILRIHDILVEKGVKIEPVGSLRDPFTSEYDIDGSAITNKNNYFTMMEGNAKSELEKSLKVIPDFKTSNDELRQSIKYALLPLYYDYIEANKLSIKVQDKKWNSIDSVTEEEGPEYKKTIEFIRSSSKYASLLGGVQSLTRYEGGLLLNAKCPIKDLLAENGLFDSPPYEDGQMRGSRELTRGGFVPFWMTLYLAETLRGAGFRPYIEKYRGKSRGSGDLNRTIMMFNIKSLTRLLQ
jgi:hypothetical protein